MKNLKRALSFALATVMLVGMMVVGASAASFNDVADIENIDAVNTLVALGIIKGKDTGDFDPAGTVTRAEMAKMICVALNGGKDPNFTGTGLYPDTKGHWAAGYIDYCTNMGIVSGDTAGNFNPDKAVTGTEAAKMLLIALGFNAETEKFVNDASWALNIDRRATEKELYEDVSGLPGAALSRDNAAQMIFNALQATKVKYEISGIINGTSVSSAVDTTKTILGSTFKVNTYEGTMTEIEWDEEKEQYVYWFGGYYEDNQGKWQYTPYYDSFKSAEDYSDLFSMNSKVLYKVKNNEVVVYGIFAEDSIVVAEGLVGGMSVSDEKIKINGTTYKWEGGDLDQATAAANKALVNAYAYNVYTATNWNLAQASAEVKLIDDNNNGKIDHIVFMPFTVDEVTYVTKDSFKAGSTIKFEDVTVEGDITKNCFVKITAKANTVFDKDVYEVIDEVITGKVTEKDPSGKYAIDGNWYKLAGVSLIVGNSYKKMPVVNGYIFSAESKGTAIAADEYAVVTAAQAKGGLYSNHRAILLMTSGEKVTVDTEYDYTSLIDQLVTFSIDDDVYTLTPVSGKGAFDDTVAGDYEDSKINGNAIADDAVIFIKGTSSTKVITGAELKKADDKVVTVINGYVETNDTTGFKTVVMAYVSGSIVSTSDNLYGYVTAAKGQALDKDDKTVDTITLWNGSEKVTLTAKFGTDTTAATKGALIVYKVNADGLVTKVEAITNTTGDANAIKLGATKGAVTAYDGEDIVFDGSVKAEITEDTVIMTINATDVAGVKADAISLADKNEAGDAYIDNVYYATKANGSKTEVVLIVVEDTNVMP